MTWIFQDAASSFDQYASEWEALNRDCGGHVLLDPLFVRSLLRHWGRSGLLLGHSRSAGGRGIVLLEEVRKGFWQTFSPSQAPLGLILLEKGSNVQEQVRGMIRNLPGYALGLSITNQDPQATSVSYCPNKDRMIEVMPYIDTASVTVDRTFDEYWNSRGKDLVTNQARRRRRLATSGVEVVFVAERDPARVADCIVEYSRLEESGWKGTAGTAVSATNEQGLFYRDIMERFAEKGEGTIYQLYFNGKTVASQLALHRMGMLVFLKMAYDEAFKQAAPGYLLRESILREVFHQGEIRTVEFYGKVRDGWTMKWTEDVRGLYHLNCYRHAWVSDARAILKSMWARLSRRVVPS